MWNVKPELDANQLTAWFQENYRKLNEDKCHLSLFGANKEMVTGHSILILIGNKVLNNISKLYSRWKIYWSIHCIWGRAELPFIQCFQTWMILGASPNLTTANSRIASIQQFYVFVMYLSEISKHTTSITLLSVGEGRGEGSPSLIN